MIDPDDFAWILSGFSPILVQFFENFGLMFFVPFLATTTFEFENFSVLRNFCLNNAPSFFEKIPCFVQISHPAFFQNLTKSVRIRIYHLPWGPVPDSHWGCIRMLHHAHQQNLVEGNHIIYLWYISKFLYKREYLPRHVAQ